IACHADARGYCRRDNARRRTASRPGACRPSHGRCAKIRLLSYVPLSEAVFADCITDFGDEIITGFRHFSSGAAFVSGEASAFGARFGRGGRVDCAFLPSVRISVIRTRVYSWRWPRLRREFLRRRFLKAMTFGPRPCSRISPATLAPATAGVPSTGVSPPTTSTSPNSTTSPGWPASLATCSTSSRATRYCLPPVLMTANLVFILVFDPGARTIRTGFLAVGLCSSAYPGEVGTGSPKRVCADKFS